MSRHLGRTDIDVMIGVQLQEVKLAVTACCCHVKGLFEAGMCIAASCQALVCPFVSF